MSRSNFIYLCIVLLAIAACKSDSNQSTSTPTVVEEKKPLKIPAVSADSTYTFVKTQVDMGPRVPGSPAHRECRDWIVNKMESYGMQVKLQAFKATTYTDFTFDADNIIASYKPELKKRIILAAHWDTRFIADQDDKDQDKPILGADDGGSGVAVLIELARVINQNPLDMGVDFIFFDAEDQGDSENNTEHSYCLGSQYWSKNVPKGYVPDFGILFDMVGAKGAVFLKEGFSMHYAKEYTEDIWQLAQSMGYGNMFTNGTVGALTDDHRYVNEIANIPMLDIIHTSTNPEPRTTFGAHWHTHRDCMDVIDKNTLRVVAQVASAAIYRYDANRL